MKTVGRFSLANWIRTFVLILIAIVIVGPFFIVVSGSMRTLSALFMDPLGLPIPPDFTAFLKVATDARFPRYFMNSVIVTAGANSILTVLAVMTSYAVARIPGWAGLFLFGLFTVGMMIPTQVTMVPLYLLLWKLGLLNTHAGMIMVYVGFAMGFSVFVVSSFMRTLPASLLEAATIDGAGEGRMLLNIVTPLSLPAVATVVTFNFVWIWNDLLFPMLFLSREAMRTLPLGLLRYTGEYLNNYPLFFAGVLIASIPMFIVYITLQKYFVEGLTAGALKG